MPVVSVIIPTHNRADLLPEAVRSVLEQTQADLELIVVDDCSTDATPAVMDAFAADPRVRYARLTRQGERSAARNHGADLAQADLLGFLDSDDRYLPGTLDAHLQAFTALPTLGMTVGGYETIAADGGEVLSQRRPWEEGGDLGRLEPWLFNCYATPSSVLLRRQWFEHAGRFETDRHLLTSEDWHLFLKLARASCPMAWVRGLVYQYRRHPGSSVANIAAHHAASLYALDNIFREDSLPAETVALEGRAQAEVHLRFARKYYAAGQDAPAAAALQSALALHPRLAGAEKLHLLEYLMGRDSQGDTLVATDLATRLPSNLSVTPAELRWAESRVAMAQFFRLRHRASLDARRYLWAGLRRDPRWLVNRGVLSFLVKQALGS